MMMKAPACWFLEGGKSAIGRPRLQLSSRCSAFFAMPIIFFFWKKVKTHPFEPNGAHLEGNEIMISLDIFLDADETLGTPVQSRCNRIRSWPSPPNCSPVTWF